MQTKTDKELIEAYADSQDESSFAELVSRYQPLVYRTCFRLLRDAHEAEDAAQAAFIVLARKAGSLRQEGKLNGWLHRVARNVGLHALERRGDRDRQRERTAHWQETIGVQVEDGPDTEAVLREVDRELNGLSAVLREAVILRYLRGYGEKDAAAQAGCAVSAMKWRTSDGLAKLRARLAKRGVSLGAVALIGLLDAEAKAAIPETLLSSITTAVKMAATSAAGTAATGGKAMMLAKSVLKSMFWAKVKMAALVVLSVAAIGGAGAALDLNAERSTNTASNMSVNRADDAQASLGKPYATNLRLAAMYDAGEQTSLKFQAYRNAPDGTKTFIVLSPPAGRSRFLRIGDEVGGYKIVRFEERRGGKDTSDGSAAISTDTSALILEKAGLQIELVKGRTTPVPSKEGITAVLLFGAQNATVKVGIGDKFELLDEKYVAKSISLQKQSVVVRNDADGKEFALQGRTRPFLLSDFRADSVNHDKLRGNVEFSGRAACSNREFAIRADQIIITHLPGSAFKSVTAAGNVSFKSAAAEGLCDRLVLTEKNSWAIMTGHAGLTFADGSILNSGQFTAAFFGGQLQEAATRPAIPDAVRDTPPLDICTKLSKALAEAVRIALCDSGNVDPLEVRSAIDMQLAEIRTLRKELQSENGGTLSANDVRRITTGTFAELGIKLSPGADKPLDEFCSGFARQSEGIAMVLSAGTNGVSANFGESVNALLAKLPSVTATEDQAKVREILSKVHGR